MKLTGEQIDELVSFLKILADRNRIRILGLLGEREYSVRELAGLLEVTEPTVSNHLNMLKLRGMVEMRPDGNTHLYKLSQDSIRNLLKDLSGKANSEHEEDPNSSQFEKRVLSHFFDSKGVLKEIPTKVSKQLVVLRHLAKSFRFGEFYTELEVNATLKPSHPDVATLRRYMVDQGVMSRKDGKYWLLDPRPASE